MSGKQKKSQCYEYKNYLETGNLRKDVLRDVAKSCGAGVSGTKEQITRRINAKTREQRKEKAVKKKTSPKK